MEEIALPVQNVMQIVASVRLELEDLNTVAHHASIRIRNLDQYLAIQANSNVNARKNSF